MSFTEEEFSNETLATNRDGGPSFPVVERFVSINGEGLRAGRLAAFIRMAGCNLACSWCDTSWANEDSCPHETLRVSDLVSWVKSTCVSCVTLTGGEPALQPDLDKLVEALVLSPDWGCGLPSNSPGCALRAALSEDQGQTQRTAVAINFDSLTKRVVELETNGSLDLMQLHQLRQALAERATIPTTIAFTVDCKLPSSGMFAEMLESNYELLTPDDVVKFVIAGREDLEAALTRIREFDLTSKCEVLFSPVFSCIDPADIVAFMEAHALSTVRLQMQLHKIIWPHVDKGV